MPGPDYNECGIRIGKEDGLPDIPAIRLLEDGYVLEDLNYLCSGDYRPGPLPGDETGYLKIPPALRMWSASEVFYVGLADVVMDPVFSLPAFNGNPYTGDSLNLWEKANAAGGDLGDWDDDTYDDPEECGDVVEYPHGFMKAPIPSIQFIVDTASVSVYRVPEIDFPDISLQQGDCIIIEQSSTSGGNEYEIKWDKCCFDTRDYLDIHGFSSKVESISGCSGGSGAKVRYYIPGSSCSPTLLVMTTETLGGVSYGVVSPLECPADSSKTYALTRTGNAFAWMEVAPCEEEV